MANEDSVPTLTKAQVEVLVNNNSIKTHMRNIALGHQASTSTIELGPIEWSILQTELNNAGLPIANRDVSQEVMVDGKPAMLIPLIFDKSGSGDGVYDAKVNFDTVRALCAEHGIDISSRGAGTAALLTGNAKDGQQRA